jgi:hypothetical protein
MTEFSDVRRIVQSSLAAGAGQPSRRQVRHALGDVGSLQTIGAYIDRAMVELGPAARVQPAPRAVYEPLDDDPLLRARALARRRLAEDQRTMARHLGTLMDSLRRLAPLLPAIQADLEQRARREAQARGPIPFNQQTFTPPAWRVALKHLAGAEAAALTQDAAALLAQLDITRGGGPTPDAA